MIVSSCHASSVAVLWRTRKACLHLEICMCDPKTKRQTIGLAFTTILTQSKNTLASLTTASTCILKETAHLCVCTATTSSQPPPSSVFVPKLHSHRHHQPLCSQLRSHRHHVSLCLCISISLLAHYYPQLHAHGCRPPLCLCLHIVLSAHYCPLLHSYRQWSSLSRYISDTISRCCYTFSELRFGWKASLGAFVVFNSGHHHSPFSHNESFLSRSLPSWRIKMS